MKWAMATAVIGVLLTGTTATSQPVNRFGIRTPMRDGVTLVANLWIPSATGKFPTILLRTPYLKTAQFRRYGLAAYLKAGYAVMVQDTRGRGDSEGEFDFYFPEGRDGFDTIEWIARQSWSNGRVGMDGGSYLGTVQWLAARERPPHLACIVPTASSGRLFDEIPYLGGAFRLEWALPWLHGVSGRVDQGELNDLMHWDSLMVQRPLVRLDSLMGRPIPLYQALFAHPTLDSYWQRIQFTDADFAKIQIPVLTVTGWFDGDQPGALFYWDGMERRAAPSSPHYLIAGPWVHAETYLGGHMKQGLFALDSAAIFPIQKERIKFFDWCLKQATPSYDAPRVRVLSTGSNRWREADRYPIAETDVRSLFLRSGGRANTMNGDGTLSWDRPTSEPSDQFRYDPTKPVPAGPTAVDHRIVEGRDDILVYSSAALTEATEILGRVFVKLWAASDGLDTDFTAKLLDVFPDGKSVLLGSQDAGVRRARYRDGYQKTKMLTPGKPEEFSIELFDIGHVFEPGHRIRLEISSSVSPFVSPNPNTGLDIGTDTTFRTALQTVLHDDQHPSRVLLPVVPPR